jgi:hypothetical protein
MSVEETIIEILIELRAMRTQNRAIIRQMFEVNQILSKQLIELSEYFNKLAEKDAKIYLTKRQ